MKKRMYTAIGLLKIVVKCHHLTYGLCHLLKAFLKRYSCERVDWI